MGGEKIQHYDSNLLNIAAVVLQLMVQSLTAAFGYQGGTVTPAHPPMTP